MVIKVQKYLYPEYNQVLDKYEKIEKIKKELVDRMTDEK